MSWFFSSPPPPPEPTPKQIARATQRDVRTNQRQLDREINDLERREAQTQQEIKRLVKRGDQTSAKHLAREIVRMRQQREKLLNTRSQLQCIGTRTTTMASTATITTALSGATNAMAHANNIMNMPQMQATMAEFQRQSDIADMNDEMLDDMFDDEDQEEETFEILSQVSEEIGLDLVSQMRSVPTRAVPAQSQADSDDVSDAEIDRLMAQLTA